MRFKRKSINTLVEWLVEDVLSEAERVRGGRFTDEASEDLERALTALVKAEIVPVLERFEFSGPRLKSEGVVA